MAQLRLIVDPRWAFNQDDPWWLAVWIVGAIVAVSTVLVVTAMVLAGKAPWDHAFNVCRRELYVDRLRDGFRDYEAWTIAAADAEWFCR